MSIRLENVKVFIVFESNLQMHFNLNSCMSVYRMHFTMKEEKGREKIECENVVWCELDIGMY